MTQRWEAALDAQLDFVSRCASSPTEREYIDAWMRSYNGKGPYGIGDESMADRLAIMSFNADVIYVDPDMMTIWERSLEGFQPERFVVEDLVTPAGFLWFPRPHYSIDINGKQVATRAIMWHPSDTVVMESVSAVEKAMGELPQPYTARVGEMEMPARKVGDTLVASGIFLAVLTDSSDKDDFPFPKELNLTTGLHISHLMPWPYGSTFSKEPGEAIGVLEYQALWRLMQQTLAVWSSERPDRSTRRRLARANMPERNVSVVRLRRAEAHRGRDGDPKVVNWTHRWLVGGHWRRQPYPSLGITRQIWISPYVKGDPELPLVARKTRIFELVR